MFAECVSEHSERRGRADSPCRPGEGPDEPDGEMAVPDGVHSVPKRPTNVRNEHVDETDAPDQDRALGGHRSKKWESRVVEGDSDHANVVHRAGYDGIG
jgi:hypothetical protein